MTSRVNVIPTVGPLGNRYMTYPLPWQTVPLHPTIAQSPTTAHRIHNIYPYKGILYIGYGDWDNNLGPVKVVGYNMSTLEPVTLMDEPVPSEAMDNFREIDGKLYIPWTDPTVSHQGGYTTNVSGTWQNVKAGPPVGLVHTFDVIEFKGNIYVCGSTPVGVSGAGVVYKREANGSWTNVLTSTNVSDLSRFYRFNDPRWGISIPEGTLVVHDAASDSSQKRYFSTTDGITWTSQVSPKQTPPQSSILPNDFEKIMPWQLHPTNATDPEGYGRASWNAHLANNRVWTINSNRDRVLYAPAS